MRGWGTICCGSTWCRRDPGMGSRDTWREIGLCRIRYIMRTRLAQGADPVAVSGRCARRAAGGTPRRSESAYTMLDGRATHVFSVSDKRARINCHTTNQPGDRRWLISPDWRGDAPVGPVDLRDPGDLNIEVLSRTTVHVSRPGSRTTVRTTRTMVSAFIYGVFSECSSGPRTTSRQLGALRPPLSRTTLRKHMKNIIPPNPQRGLFAEGF